MNIFSFESKVWWLAVPDEIRSASGIPIVNAVTALNQRYKFAGWPMQLPGTNEGYRFREGAATIGEKTITITEFVVFNDGVSVEVPSNTDDLMMVLEDLLTFGRELGLRAPITPPRLLYVSNLVVELNGNINNAFAGFDELASRINSAIGVGGKHDARGFEFCVDPSHPIPGWGTLNPTTFRIERRAGIEYDKSRYFTQANTTTSKHVEILEYLESRVRNDEAAN